MTLDERGKGADPHDGAEAPPREPVASVGQSLDLDKFIEPALVDDADLDEARERRDRVAAWAKDRAQREGPVILHGFKFVGSRIAPDVHDIVTADQEPKVSNVTAPGRASCYYPINPSRVPASLKTSKHHVIEVRRLGVDLDVTDHPDTPKKLDDLRTNRALADRLWQHQLAGRRAIGQTIEEYAKRHGSPTTCIDSGGGLQLLFDSDQPIVLPPGHVNERGEMLREDGTVTTKPDECALNPEREKVIADIEARNLGLIERFDAIVAELGVGHLVKVDHTQNIDRIFRVPGSANRPCEKKRRSGRRPTWARLVFEDPTITYRLDSFPVVAVKQQRPSRVGGANRPTVNIPTGKVKRIPAVELQGVLAEYGFTDEHRIVRLIFDGYDTEGVPIPGKDQTRSGVFLFVCCELVRHEVPDDLIYAIVTDPAYKISKHPLSQGRGCDRAVRRALEEGYRTKPVVLRGNSRQMAQTFRDMRFPTLLRTNGDYLDHTGTHYVEAEDDTVKAEVWDFLDAAKVMKDGKPVPFPLSKKTVGEVWEPFQLLVHKPREQGDGHQRWLRGGTGQPPAAEILALPNGLLHVPTRRLLPHTPDFFTRNLIDIAYDPDARAERWGSFLEELWPDDPAQRALLQEVVGYLLIPDTSLQKLFFIKGPRRSGKGTILRTIADLVGQSNVTGPSLNRVNQGTAPLEPLLGKLVWLISDLHLENRAMPGAVERLLNITGEDWLSVERKYKPNWEGVLAVRIIMASNTVPRLRDPSGALAGRIVPLEIEPSFFGKEDSRLQEKLRAELPGILNWALAGWARLHERGRFELPARSKAMVDSIYRTGSHVVAFLADRCVEDASAKVGKDVLFITYRAWCEVNDVRHTLTKEEFGAEVAAAMHGVVKNGQKLPADAAGHRAEAWGGIRLADDGQADEEDVF